MKNNAVAAFVISCLLFPCVGLAEGGSALSLGVRQHVDHSVYTELPFDDGDLSYGIAYEIHEEQAFWQLAVEYAPDISSTNSVDFVLTPQLNLICKDRCWRGGVGVLMTYIAGDDDDDWTDLYWQLMFGIQLDSTRPEIDVFAYYPFEKWSDIGDFDGKDVEFGLWLCFPF